VDELDAGGAAWTMEQAGGALWVQVDPPVDAIVRIDIKSGKATPAVPGGHHVASGPEGVWVSSETWLERVEPDDGKRIHRVPIGGDIALGAGSVWVFNAEGLHRVDPATGTVALEVARRSTELCLEPGGLHVAFGSAWVACKEGKVLRIEIERGKVTQIPTESGSHSFAATDAAVWVTNYEAGTVSRIDATSNAVTTIPDVGNYTGITAGGGYVWTSSNDGIAKIDPETASIVATAHLEYGLGVEIYDLVWDKGTIWATYQSNLVMKVDASKAVSAPTN
jgi:hypothetical protein